MIAAVRSSAVLSVIGACIGLLLSVVVGRALRAGTGMPAGDPVLLGVVVLGMLATTLLAAAIPARRASRLDPQRALRRE